MTSISALKQSPKIKSIAKFLVRSLTVILILILAVTTYLFIPISDVKPTQIGPQISNYDQAIQKFAILQAKDGTDIISDCRSAVLSHGKKTSKAIVLFHGFTSCPKQFDQFSQLLFEQGYNVLMPRLPFHGLNDLNTRDQNKLEASQILNLTQESVMIASGLGENVETFGLSGGGVMSLWAGLNLSQVSKSVVVSPIIRPYLTKDYPLNPVIKILDTAPDQYVYWDDQLKDKAEFAPYAYKGFSTKALAQFLKIGSTVVKQISTNPNSRAKFILITSEIDQAVDNSLAVAVFDSLKAQAKITQTHFFTKTDNIPHDSIDPRNTAGNTAFVYPKVLEWIQD